MKERYTIKDVIVDTSNPRLSYFDEIYVGDTPSEVLKHANNDDKDYLGSFTGTDDHHGYSYFILDNDNQGYQCAIIKKRQKAKYTPFLSLDSFIFEYMLRSQEVTLAGINHLAQTGIWLATKGNDTSKPVYKYVSELSDDGLRVSDKFICWKDLLSKEEFTFMDGSPCGCKEY